MNEQDRMEIERLKAIVEDCINRVRQAESEVFHARTELFIATERIAKKEV